MSFSSFFPWFVVFASFIVRVIVYGITYTSGIIYVIVLKNFQTGKADTSWISSIITTVMFAAGPPSGRLVKSLGWRVVAVVGGIIAGTGLLLTSLTSNLLFLILSYGFVTGFGCGMAYMVACVAVPAHFRGHRRQKMAVAMASCGSGVGTFIFSPIVQYVNVTYGWQNLYCSGRSWRTVQQCRPFISTTVRLINHRRRKDFRKNRQLGIPEKCRLSHRPSWLLFCGLRRLNSIRSSGRVCRDFGIYFRQRSLPLFSDRNFSNDSQVVTGRCFR